MPSSNPLFLAIPVCPALTGSRTPTSCADGGFPAKYCTTIKQRPLTGVGGGMWMSMQGCRAGWRGWKVRGTAAEWENWAGEGRSIQKEKSWRYYEGVSSLFDIK